MTLSGPQELLPQDWVVLSLRQMLTPRARQLLSALGCSRGWVSCGLYHSVESRVLAPRSQEDGQFSVDDFRCLWNVYRNEQLLPEDLADMFQRVTGGPRGQHVFPDAPVSKMPHALWMLGGRPRLSQQFTERRACQVLTRSFLTNTRPCTSSLWD